MSADAVTKAAEALARLHPRERLWTRDGRVRVVRAVLDAVGYDALAVKRDALVAELEFAADEIADMLPYVPDWAREKWGYDASLARVRAALDGGS